MQHVSEIQKTSKNCVEKNIPVPWGVIAAKCWGNSSFSPVLMVHGIMDNAGSFDRLMPFLPNSFYFVCIDLPGHGKSSKFPNGIFLDLMLYVSALKRVILYLEWTDFIFIGHSLGGQLGSYYSALYPFEVTKLIMLDTLSQITVSLDGYIEYYQQYILWLLQLEYKLSNSNPPSYTYEECLRRMLNNRASYITEDAAKALLSRGTVKNNDNTFYFSNDQKLKFSVRTPITTQQHLKLISRIECPVLLVISKVYLHFVENFRTDQYDIETLKLLKKKNNAQIVSVDGHHDLHNNEPESVAPFINKFLLHFKSSL